MPRPNKDGTPARAARKHKFSELFVKRVRAEGKAFAVWDAKEGGLAPRIQPSGHRAFKFVYSHRGRPRWFHIGDVHLADARRIAARLRAEVAGRTLWRSGRLSAARGASRNWPMTICNSTRRRTTSPGVRPTRSSASTSCRVGASSTPTRYHEPTSRPSCGASPLRSWRTRCSQPPARSSPGRSEKRS